MSEPITLPVAVGSHVLVHVPPGWMLAGTVREVLGERLVLTDCVYLEACASGTAMTQLCTATSAKAQRAIVSRSWPMPDGTLVMPLIVMPMVRDVRPLARSAEAHEVERT